MDVVLLKSHMLVRRDFCHVHNADRETSSCSYAGVEAGRQDGQQLCRCIHTVKVFTAVFDCVRNCMTTPTALYVVVCQMPASAAVL